MSSQSISCISLHLLLAALMLSPSRATAEFAESTLLPGEVIEGHAKYEKECSNCHKETASDIRTHRGLHGRLKEHECRTCHTDHKGRNARITEFDKAAFKHDETGFILEDKHRAAKCEGCHKPKLKYRDTPSKCDSCHHKDDVHKGKLGPDCGNCHDAKGWKKSSFDHEKSRFKLAGGKHAEVECVKCHFDKARNLDKTFKGATTECASCHRTDDLEKAHKGRYGAKCETCHTDRGWKELRFNHDRDTRYALRDIHAQVKCDLCHLPPKPLYNQHLSTKCAACHHKDDMEKGHRGRLGDKCESCHTTKGWKTTDFDHDKNTKFPLKGKHRDAKCDACHKGGVAGGPVKKVMEKLETTCIGCHRKDDLEKGHKGNYGTRCESCHAESGWKDLIFDHTRDTKYPLKGRHAQTRCKSCHAPDRPLYGQALKSTCVSCHRKDDMDKGHKDQLGQKCESCHTEESWKKATFDHQHMSAFPLLGGHMLVPCRKCHATVAFKDASRECFGCHEKDDTHHRRLGTECQVCHTTRSWRAWDFDHNKTRFRLDGPHEKVAGKCNDCHQKPMAKKVLASTACGSCHDRDDVHDGSFGDRCDRCHAGNGWKQVRMTGAQQ